MEPARFPNLKGSLMRYTDCVDYFPHFCHHGDSLTLIDEEFDRGYEFWFKLLEKLGSTPGHYLDISKPAVWCPLLKRSKMPEDQTRACLDRMAELEMIDKDLYLNKIIWSDHFVDGVSSVYRDRKRPIPQRPELPKSGIDKHYSKPRSIPAESYEIRRNTPESGGIPRNTADSVVPTPESKEKERNKSKVKEEQEKSVPPAAGGLLKKLPEEQKPENPKPPTTKPDHVVVNGKYVHGSFIRSLSRQIGGDIYEAYRYLYRARLSDNPQAFILAGLKPNTDPAKDKYILKPLAEESSNPAAVKRWIEINIENRWSGANGKPDS